MHGRRDVRELAKTGRIPGARHVAIAGASHAPFISHAEQVLEALDGFLGATA